MAPRGSNGWIGRAIAIEATETAARASDRYEQEYEIHDQWTSLFLSMLSAGHGGYAITRKHRGAASRILVQAKDLATLAKIEEEFVRLIPPLGQELAKALYEFCQANVPKSALPAE